MLRFVCLVSASVIALTVVAYAADTYAPTYGAGGYKDEPVPYPSWTGLYLGGNVGGAWEHSDWTGNTTLIALGNPGTQTLAFGQNASGILGGGQAGINYQLPSNLVAGIEADIEGSGIGGSGAFCSTNITPSPSAPGTFGNCGRADTKLEDFGTIRGRLGYAFGTVLLYGTGGFAWGESSTSTLLTCNGEPGVSPKCTGQGGGPGFAGGNASSSQSFAGWAAGAGAEWRFRPSWSMRLEYLHLQFGNIGQTFTMSGAFLSTPGTYSSTVNTRTNMDVDIVRVGVNYFYRDAYIPLK
jgi:outer membrane immunogenic protein